VLNLYWFVAILCGAVAALTDQEEPQPPAKTKES